MEAFEGQTIPVSRGFGRGWDATVQHFQIPVPVRFRLGEPALHLISQGQVLAQAGVPGHDLLGGGEGMHGRFKILAQAGAAAEKIEQRGSDRLGRRSLFSNPRRQHPPRFMPITTV